MNNLGYIEILQPTMVQPVSWRIKLSSFDRPASTASFPLRRVFSECSLPNCSWGPWTRGLVDWYMLQLGIIVDIDKYTRSIAIERYWESYAILGTHPNAGQARVIPRVWIPLPTLQTWTVCKYNLQGRLKVGEYPPKLQEINEKIVL